MSQDKYLTDDCVHTVQYIEYLLYTFMQPTTLITKKSYFQRSGNKSEDNSTNQQFIQHRLFFVAEILYCQRFVGTSSFVLREYIELTNVYVLSLMSWMQNNSHFACICIIVMGGRYVAELPSSSLS